MRFENWTIEDLIARCTDFDEMTLEMDREEFAALRRKITELKQAGNSPVIPGAEQRIADAVELLKQAAPAMLADNGGPDGPLVGRLKSPVIPDGSMAMLRRWLAFGRGMQNAGSQLPRNLIAETEEMLAAVPQPQNAPQNSPEIIPGWIPVSERMPDCWCRTCRPVVSNDMRFVVCPDCGNKRCPRANDHRNACTGSNEPGQEGSAYQAAPQEVSDGK